MKTLDIYKTLKYLSLFNEINTNINKITIDTRKIEKNDCYIGIKGEKNDGNKFFMDAFEKGASLVILDNFEMTDDKSNFTPECLGIGYQSR